MCFAPRPRTLEAEVHRGEHRASVPGNAVDDSFTTSISQKEDYDGQTHRATSSTPYSLHPGVSAAREPACFSEGGQPDLPFTRGATRGGLWLSSGTAPPDFVQQSRTCA